MKSKLLLYWFALTAITLVGRSQVIVPATTYSAPAPVEVVSGSTLTNDTNAVTVSSGATVTYVAATSITLKPGFHAATGAKFYAAIGSTADTDGDGIPDGWEKTHGLNPSNGSDAAGTTSGGLTYLLEYRLGTTPGTTKQTDTSNTTALKVHRPQ